MNKVTLIGLFLLSDLFAMGLFFFGVLQSRGDGDFFSNPLMLAALALFFLGPLAIVVFYLLNRPVADEVLLRTGQSTYANVLETWEIHSGSGSVSAVGLKLQVNPPDAPSYETKLTQPVSVQNPRSYRAGMVLKVRYDPKHPKRVVVEESSFVTAYPAAASELPQAPAGMPEPPSPYPQVQRAPQVLKTPESQPGLSNVFTSTTTYQVTSDEMGNLPPVLRSLVQAALVDADHDGVPDVLEKIGENNPNLQVVNFRGNVDPQKKLDQLHKLLEAGLINQQQYEMLRGMLEKALQQREQPPGGS